MDLIFGWILELILSSEFGWDCPENSGGFGSGCGFALHFLFTLSCILDIDPIGINDSGVQTE